MPDILQKATPMAKKIFIEIEKIFQTGLQNESIVEKFESCLKNLYELDRTNYFQLQFDRMQSIYSCIGTDSTLQGRSRIKPYGYAGDFNIIDKIYTNYISDDSYCAQWDKYFHEQKAPNAVRNRKKYFIDLLNSNIDIKSTSSILNLASGPGRDMLEYLDISNNKNVHFDCVELDNNAIDYAGNLLSNYKDQVNFTNKNIFRFTPDRKYDIIWSAGLFDYFDDKTFVRILGILISTNPEAKIVIGNFSDANPTQPYMEIIGEWFLNYRSSERLIEMAVEAGADIESVKVECEEEKVNLFLHIN